MATSDFRHGTPPIENLIHRIAGQDLVFWHRRNGTNIDSREYLARYRQVLISGLSRTCVIYLDTNYWVRLREAELGRGTPEAFRLLQTLRAMVRSREVLCVSQFNSFLELGKQDEASLRVTARLVDELSEGVAIASSNDLREWECAEFICAKLNLQIQHELCTWTKVGQIHKNELPNWLPGPATDAGKEVILKSLIDTLWNASFEDVFGQFGWATKVHLNAEIDSDVLIQVEERKSRQKARGLSRKQVRLDEFSQFVYEQLRPVFTKQLRSWHIRHGFPEGLAVALIQLRMVLDSAITEFEAGTLGSLLPYSTMLVELYALYETSNHDKKPLTNNDWVDWNHAAAALANCDMFLTERHLAHLLRQELKADRQYGCEVIGTLEEALLRLEGRS